LAAVRGASLVRVHDVAETAQALRLIEAAEATRTSGDEASDGDGPGDVGAPLAPEADARA
ncbi:MAG: hypothetical protein AAFQ43_07130, partial [Bacteroidota bacterium]